MLKRTLYSEFLEIIEEVPFDRWLGFIYTNCNYIRAQGCYLNRTVDYAQKEVLQFGLDLFSFDLQ